MSIVWLIIEFKDFQDILRLFLVEDCHILWLTLVEVCHILRLTLVEDCHILRLTLVEESHILRLTLVEDCHIPRLTLVEVCLKWDSCEENWWLRHCWRREMRVLCFLSSLAFNAFHFNISFLLFSQMWGYTKRKNFCIRILALWT